MNTKQLIGALSISAKSGLIAGIVTMLYGLITKDYTQVIPAVVFSFGTAMGISGYYDRRLNRLGLN
jgi:hypothetical protein